MDQPPPVQRTRIQGIERDEFQLIKESAESVRQLHGDISKKTKQRRDTKKEKKKLEEALKELLDTALAWARRPVPTPLSTLRKIRLQKFPIEARQAMRDLFAVVIKAKKEVNYYEEIGPRCENVARLLQDQVRVATGSLSRDYADDAVWVPDEPELSQEEFCTFYPLFLGYQQAIENRHRRLIVCRRYPRPGCRATSPRSRQVSPSS
jgi:hypothetical protein